MARVPISAFVITRNEELKIADCLASLSWVHEIVVVDDFSSDRTADICRQAGVRLIQHSFTGFRDQKSHAMSLTSHDWVLELDADERVSEKMRQSIEALTEDDLARHSSFSFPRITRFWGKWIRHSSLYPDRKERLYHKPSGAWSDKNIHE
ncbi:MAG TPA: glycosyltransferase family 2 protein, partial [Geobacterales bacterium]|nr:glycosyltransferase family 2 protein [Geobacterales bacterium]